MINISDAFKIIKDKKPNFNIANHFELPDRYAFVLIPEGVDPKSYTTGCTFVNKTDGSITVGAIVTAEEMRYAKKAYR